MKKLLCIMLTGIMIMSLSACSSTNDSSEDGIASVKESTDSAQKEESESVNGGAESTDSAEGSVESASSKETTPENFVSLENGSPVYSEYFDFLESDHYAGNMLAACSGGCGSVSYRFYYNDPDNVQVPEILCKVSGNSGKSERTYRGDLLGTRYSLRI